MNLMSTKCVVKTIGIAFLLVGVNLNEASAASRFGSGVRSLTRGLARMAVATQVPRGLSISFSKTLHTGTLFAAAAPIAGHTPKVVLDKLYVELEMARKHAEASEDEFLKALQNYSAQFGRAASWYDVERHMHSFYTDWKEKFENATRNMCQIYTFNSGLSAVGKGAAIAALEDEISTDEEVLALCDSDYELYYQNCIPAGMYEAVSTRAVVEVRIKLCKACLEQIQSR
jgi:hypothetical protein